jgi:putative oxidoreductase
MPAFVTFGRLLFAVFFLYSGAAKLVAIPATADVIASKLSMPEVLTPYTQQAEQATGRSTPQLLAIAVGVGEILCGLMIALNLGVRFFSLLLVLYVAVGTYYFHDFWNQEPPENGKTIVDALKNLAIIGALFVLAGYGRATRTIETAYTDA